MAPGDTAKQYLANHSEDIHPVTGRPPVVLTALKEALEDKFMAGADAIVRNYEGHGSIEAELTSAGRSVEKR